MGIRENFADEEWKNLLRMPYAVSIAVMAAEDAIAYKKWVLAI
jgi:hypothetical protein